MAQFIVCLSVIGALQQKYQGFFGAMSENPKIPFLKFFGLECILLLFKVAFSNVRTLGDFSERLSC